MLGDVSKEAKQECGQALAKTKFTKGEGICEDASGCGRMCSQTEDYLCMEEICSAQQAERGGVPVC